MTHYFFKYIDGRKRIPPIYSGNRGNCGVLPLDKLMGKVMGWTELVTGCVSLRRLNIAIRRCLPFSQVYYYIEYIVHGCKKGLV